MAALSEGEARRQHVLLQLGFAKMRVEEAERTLNLYVEAARACEPPLTWKEIGKQLGVSAQAVSQMQKRGTRLF